MKSKLVTEQSELEQALALRMDVFVKEQGVASDEEVDEYDESPSACRHFLVTDEGEPVAAGRWKAFEPGVAKLQRIAVRLPYRGRSIGRLLVSAMEEDASALGYDSAVLDAQCSAEPFYEKLGYTTISAEPFYDAGILHVRMSKALR
ncbi:GNAT family N-acetyltransferase [Cohnella hashimotonis]|uniref:GNAT family N-acetyltransferase n=1 Tax=Cohnella hashimotonis TaxID=2826895 RepID=A0ABT6TFK7_9BACL|nr:GNAT family N-acetyltransferase [Cohnella hashimotonis]MDI4645615.1 GNAT family N-acetyltransferase [Cohnella hashimotonis]